jgi:hypothetical protein
MVNGQTLPVPLPDGLTGKPITAIVDRDGRILDLKGTDGNAGIAAAIKPFMANTLSFPATVTLAPGETATSPLAAELPLPLPGGSANGMTMTGEIRYTLVSVESGNAGRIAHMSTSLTGRVVTQDIQTPAGTMSMTMTMSGDGTLDVDVERGIVRQRKQRQTFDIEIQSGATAGAPIPPMKMTGLITLTVTAD